MRMISNLSKNPLFTRVPIAAHLARRRPSATKPGGGELGSLHAPHRGCRA